MSAVPYAGVLGAPPAASEAAGALVLAKMAMVASGEAYIPPSAGSGKNESGVKRTLDGGVSFSVDTVLSKKPRQGVAKREEKPVSLVDFQPITLEGRFDRMRNLHEGEEYTPYLDPATRGLTILYWLPYGGAIFPFAGFGSHRVPPLATLNPLAVPVVPGMKMQFTVLKNGDCRMGDGMLNSVTVVGTALSGKNNEHKEHVSVQFLSDGERISTVAKIPREHLIFPRALRVVGADAMFYDRKAGNGGAWVRCTVNSYFDVPVAFFAKEPYHCMGVPVPADFEFFPVHNSRIYSVRRQDGTVQQLVPPCDLWDARLVVPQEECNALRSKAEASSPNSPTAVMDDVNLLLSTVDRLGATLRHDAKAAEVGGASSGDKGEEGAGKPMFVTGKNVLLTSVYGVQYLPGSPETGLFDNVKLDKSGVEFLYPCKVVGVCVGEEFSFLKRGEGAPEDYYVVDISDYYSRGFIPIARKDMNKWLICVPASSLRERAREVTKGDQCVCFFADGTVFACTVSREQNAGDNGRVNVRSFPMAVDGATVGFINVPKDCLVLKQEFRDCKEGASVETLRCLTVVHRGGAHDKSNGKGYFFKNSDLVEGDWVCVPELNIADIFPNHKAMSGEEETFQQLTEVAMRSAKVGKVLGTYFDTTVMKPERQLDGSVKTINCGMNMVTVAIPRVYYPHETWDVEGSAFDKRWGVKGQGLVVNLSVEERKVRPVDDPTPDSYVYLTGILEGGEPMKLAYVRGKHSHPSGKAWNVILVEPEVRFKEGCPVAKEFASELRSVGVKHLDGKWNPVGCVFTFRKALVESLGRDATKWDRVRGAMQVGYVNTVNPNGVNSLCAFSHSMLQVGKLTLHGHMDYGYWSPDKKPLRVLPYVKENEEPRSLEGMLAQVHVGGGSCPVARLVRGILPPGHTDSLAPTTVSCSNPRKTRGDDGKEWRYCDIMVCPLSDSPPEVLELVPVSLLRGGRVWAVGEKVLVQDRKDPNMFWPGIVGKFEAASSGPSVGKVGVVRTMFVTKEKKESLQLTGVPHHDLTKGRAGRGLHVPRPNAVQPTGEAVITHDGSVEGLEALALFRMNTAEQGMFKGIRASVPPIFDKYPHVLDGEHKPLIGKDSARVASDLSVSRDWDYIFALRRDDLFRPDLRKDYVEVLVPPYVREMSLLMYNLQFPVWDHYGHYPEELYPRGNIQQLRLFFDSVGMDIGRVYVDGAHESAKAACEACLAMMGGKN